MLGFSFRRFIGLVLFSSLRPASVFLWFRSLIIGGFLLSVRVPFSSMGPFAFRLGLMAGFSVFVSFAVVPPPLRSV